MNAERVVRSEDFPHGLRCISCDRELRDGDHYSEQLTGMTGEPGGPPAFTARIVCVPCGLGLPAEPS